MTRLIHWLALVLIPLWWMFHLLWNPTIIDGIATLTYRLESPSSSLTTIAQARNRALTIATRGTSDDRDVIFTANEVSHLDDVSKLYTPISRVLNFLSACAWILLLAALLKQQSIVQSLKQAAMTYGVLVGLLIVCSFFFQWFFTQFHASLFPQGNWQFPDDSLLIQTFPETFWKLIVVFVMLLCAGVAGLYALLSLLGTKSSSNDESTP